MPFFLAQLKWLDSVNVHARYPTSRSWHEVTAATERDLKLCRALKRAAQAKRLPNNGDIPPIAAHSA